MKIRVAISVSYDDNELSYATNLYNAANRLHADISKGVIEDMAHETATRVSDKIMRLIHEENTNG